MRTQVTATCLLAGILGIAAPSPAKPKHSTNIYPPPNVLAVPTDSVITIWFSRPLHSTAWEGSRGLVLKPTGDPRSVKLITPPSISQIHGVFSDKDNAYAMMNTKDPEVIIYFAVDKAETAGKFGHDMKATNIRYTTAKGRRGIERGFVVPLPKAQAESTPGLVAYIRPGGIVPVRRPGKKPAPKPKASATRPK